MTNHCIGSVVILLVVGHAFLVLADEKVPSPDHDTGLLHLKVDIAAPTSKDNHAPLPGTWKKGWWPWVVPDWDLYRCDLVWEDGSQSFPSGNGIAGSGVHAAVTCNYEGILTLHVAGMRRYLAGGIQPINQPLYEPICNSWVAGADFPNNPASDLLLSFYDLPAGHYRLVSFHNSFNGRRFGDNPTGVEYVEAKTPEPPMPSIKVYSMETIVTQYFDRSQDVRTAPKGRNYGSPRDKIIIPSKQVVGTVTQTLDATHAVIQQVTTDRKLQPSTIEFTTSGSPIVVVYSGGSGKPDDLRPHRRGGYAVLNAFEIIQLSR